MLRCILCGAPIESLPHTQEDCDQFLKNKLKTPPAKQGDFSSTNNKIQKTDDLGDTNG